MNCERATAKLRDKRQTSFVDLASQKRCGTEMVAVGTPPMGFTCPACGSTWLKCQGCGLMFRALETHFATSASCGYHPANAPHRNLIKGQRMRRP